MLDDQRYILEEILSLLDTTPVDGVLLAGDLYDKPVPPAEAVRLLDWFLTQLAARRLPVFDGAVELRTLDEDQLVMTVRLARTTSSSKGWTRLGIVASRQMQAKLAPDVEIADKDYRLSKALHLLN